MHPSQRPPHVLMLIEAYFPPVGGGGAESQLRTLSRHLVARGARVSVCAPVLAAYPGTRCTEVDGLPIWRLHYPDVRTLGALVMLFKLAVLLVRRRRDIDVIHAHIASNLSAVACLLGPLLGIRVVVKLTGMTELMGGILDPAGGLGARLRRWAIQRAHRVQSISGRLTRGLLAAGFAPAQVLQVPNALDLARLDQAAPPPPSPLIDDLPGKRFVAVYTGRMRPEKNLEMMVRGWARAFAGRDDVALLLLGKGPDKEPLERLAAALGVASQLRFMGAVEQVERYLPLAQVGLLTSLAEGLSNSLLEYMGAGLAPIGSAVSGNEDFIRPGENGWLFEPTDEAGFAACLLEAAALPREALAARGAAAHRLVADNASIPAVLARLAQAYGIALGPSPDSAPAHPTPLTESA